MFCAHCGFELERDANPRFCSSCGKDLAPAAAQRAANRDWNMHVNILGWLLIGTAVLTGLLAGILLFGGQIVAHLPMWIPEAASADVPFDVFRLAGSVAVLFALFTLAISVAIAAAGIGLLQYRDWGRTFAIIMCSLMVLKFPFGTAVGIYGLWVLLSERGREYYKARSTAQARA